MIIDSSLLKARFVQRNNRFLVTARLGNRRVLAHLPNPGRLKELLRPGADILLVNRPGKGRKTRYQVLGVVDSGESILLDTRLSNSIAEEAITKGRILPLTGYEVLKREFSWGGSRFDFLLPKRDSKCIVEVKACTLLKGSTAMFPDAPTLRGRRHVDTLSKAVWSGFRACVLFMVHRKGAELFLANREADPKFSESMANAMKAGVEVYAYECRWLDGRVEIARPLPVASSF